MEAGEEELVIISEISWKQLEHRTTRQLPTEYGLILSQSAAIISDYADVHLPKCARTFWEPNVNNYFGG